MGISLDSKKGKEWGGCLGLGLGLEFRVQTINYPLQ